MAQYHNLPVELLLEIASHIEPPTPCGSTYNRGDRTLLASSLFQSIAQPLIFRDFRVDGRIDARSLVYFAHSLVHRPDLAKYVRNIDLRSVIGNRYTDPTGLRIKGSFSRSLDDMMVDFRGAIARLSLPNDMVST